MACRPPHLHPTSGLLLPLLSGLSTPRRGASCPSKTPVKSCVKPGGGVCHVTPRRPADTGGCASWLLGVSHLVLTRPRRLVAVAGVHVRVLGAFMYEERGEGKLVSSSSMPPTQVISAEGGVLHRRRRGQDLSSCPAITPTARVTQSELELDLDKRVTHKT